MGCSSFERHAKALSWCAPPCRLSPPSSVPLSPFACCKNAVRYLLPAVAHVGFGMIVVTRSWPCAGVERVAEEAMKSWTEDAAIARAGGES